MARKRVAIVSNLTTGYPAGVLGGIRRYGADWSYVGLWRNAIDAVAAERPDGVIALIMDVEARDALAAWGGPLIDVANWVETAGGACRVCSDDVAAGRTAALHFRERGYVHFACFSPLDVRYARQREEGFAAALSADGLTYAVTDPALRRQAPERERRPARWTGGQQWPYVIDWLRGLPRPLAVFVPSDAHAVPLLEACGQHGVRVPDEVAVVGVDDDEVLCEFADPPLSSVGLPLGRIGFEAAAALDRLMAGERVAGPVLLPPVGVVTRRSSDALAVPDADVVSAVNYIRDRAHLPLRIDDVASHVALSRRTLEYRFRQHLGITPQEEVRRRRIEIARGLLAGTDLPVRVVAKRAGFASATQMSVTFRRHLGQTPTECRSAARGGVGA
jgi:LacI family transcriptional regulator